ncbi:hypothetical protein C0216_10075 [Streptomyces globosus]|uniref:Glutamate N-acetyltransferase n=1 Tax=Streptomyces globosus TaxID=68209 RepID=A0A344TYP1_9ACTN|nr:bifunctional ornithine acetyltransferase/N-acetylglutamate synthase [Streptomyces globosus]AXE23762.1 hypothetical protein C0216_10075 [Streptomyces globosus]
MSVTAARGFLASGVAAGIKESGDADLALVVNLGPSRAAAGVCASSRVQAAPVRWSRRVLADRRVAAVVLDSGGADAGTGPEGASDTQAAVERTARAAGADPAEVAVCSTGLIGVRLPIDRLLPGIDTASAALSPDGGSDAAVAVVDAASEEEAGTVGRSVARNNLLKCALNGEDPHWGRVLSAIGMTDAVVNPDRLDVAINGVWACRDGAPWEPLEKADLSGRRVAVTVGLRSGGASAVLWTNDLTAGYVHENSAYSS